MKKGQSTETITFVLRMLEIEKSDIIILSLSRYDATLSSPALALAKEFSKTNRVFFINHPYSFKDVIAASFKKNAKTAGAKMPWLKGKYKIVQGKDFVFTAVQPKLTLPINFLPPGNTYQLLSKRNDRVIRDTIRDLVRSYHIQQYVFINAFDPFYMQSFPPGISPLLKVYLCMDDISQEKYTARHGERLEAEIIENYDLTLTTSKELQRLKSVYSRHVYHFPNAADFGLFASPAAQKPARPIGIRDITKPIIGYIGHIGSRIDFRLIKEIAHYHQDKSVVMVGPVADAGEIQRHGLDRLDNVYFAGPKTIAELPAYLHHFSCAIIPFQCTVLTKSIYPLKINEYLAAGKPVISTSFSEDIMGFQDVIYLSKNASSFITDINVALTEDNAERIEARMLCARQNTWGARVMQFWKIVNPHCRKRSKIYLF